MLIHALNVGFIYTLLPFHVMILLIDRINMADYISGTLLLILFIVGTGSLILMFLMKEYKH